MLILMKEQGTLSAILALPEIELDGSLKQLTLKDAVINLSNAWNSIKKKEYGTRSAKIAFNDAVKWSERAKRSKR